MQGPGGHQMVPQPGPMNNSHMNGNVRPTSHVPQNIPPANMQVSIWISGRHESDDVVSAS